MANTPTTTKEKQSTPTPAHSSPQKTESNPQSKPKPAPEPKKYTIKSGDNLSKIATEFDTTVAKLAELNNIADHNAISVGQILTIPNQASSNPTNNRSTHAISSHTRLLIARINRNEHFQITIDTKSIVKDNGWSETYWRQGYPFCKNFIKSKLLYPNSVRFGTRDTTSLKSGKSYGIGDGHKYRVKNLEFIAKNAQGIRKAYDYTCLSHWQRNQVSIALPKYADIYINPITDWGPFSYFYYNDKLSIGNGKEYNAFEKSHILHAEQIQKLTINQEELDLNVVKELCFESLKFFISKPTTARIFSMRKEDGYTKMTGYHVYRGHVVANNNSGKRSRQKFLCEIKQNAFVKAAFIPNEGSPLSLHLLLRGSH